MERDNFSTLIKTLLRDRVNGVCSNPGCRVATLGAASDAGSTMSIGVAAHIHAAATGGPRYAAEMSATERASIDNGIWLCQSCSRRIDRDVIEYTPESLREWKAQAEERARREVGRRVPGAEDAHDQLLMALTKMPLSFQPNVIQNAHSALQDVLEAADRRFQVETSFREGKTVIRLKAREEVPFKFSVGASSRAVWKEQMAALYQHGQTARVPADDVRVQGSPLFDKAFTREALAGGEFVFRRDGVAAIAKISLFDPKTSTLFAMDDIAGQMTAGTQTFTFQGTSCGELLTFGFQMPVLEAPSEGDVTIALNLERWVDRDVSALPYFEKLRQFYTHISEGWLIDVKLEIEGNRILGAKMTVSAEHKVFAATHVILEYANRARILARGLSKPVTFQLSPPFSAEEHIRLAEMVDILQGEERVGAEDVSDISCVLVATEDGENIRVLDDSKLSEVVMTNQVLEPLIVFGQAIDLPPIKMTLSAVSPKIDVDVTALKLGDLVPVTWIPGVGFKFDRSFVLSH